MRTFERTHPWLTFRLDLRRAPYTLWLLLGEAQSKAQHVAGTPLLPEVQERFYQLFLAKGVLATTAIEGNTLTEGEVLRHMAGQLHLPPSKEYLAQEVSNILDACNAIGARMLDGRQASDLREEEVKAFNGLVLRSLPLGEDVVPGVYRTHSVGVGRYRAAPAEDLDELMRRYCDWLNTGFEGPPSQKMAFGILKAVMAHLYLAWIHPFGDGNGRTARLIEFQILLASGVPSVAAHLLSNFYNQTRAEYYRQLDLAHQVGGDPLPFVEYALQGFVDGLKEQIATIRHQQLAVHWVNYIHDRFRDTETKADVRRRRLALDLSQQEGPVPTGRIRYLSPRLAEAFAGKTDKTIKRDLNQLEEMGLVEQGPGGARARMEIVLAFLPQVRSEPRR